MAGQIIGRVAIKVIPDTTGFRSELRTELEKIEKSMRKLKVQATFDSTGLKSEVLKAVRALNAEMKTRDAYKVKFRAAISTQGMRGEVRKAVRELNSIAKGSDRVRFKAEIAALTADLELSEESLRLVERELERWRESVSPLKVAVAPEMLNGAGTYVAARLAYLTRPRMVPIIPVLEPGAASAVATALAALAGGRVINEMLDNIWDRLKRLDKSVPIIGTIAEAIAGLSAYGSAAASNLFALSQSLAQIGGAGLALPGILGGIIIGLGASIAVFKDFNKVIPELEERLSDLQDRMSDTFWAKAEKPIRNMIDSLFPIFARKIEETSSKLGTFFGNFATSLDGKLKPILSSMFDDLNESIVIASKNTDAFAGIIASLGQLGAGYLPRLAEWFSDISTRFDSWLNDAAADGRLTGWVDNGITQLQELGRALGNLGGLLHGLADAAEAAGGSTLTIFADTLQRIEDTVKGSTFSANFTSVLWSAHEAMSTISDRSGAAFESLMLRLSATLPTLFDTMGNTVGIAMDAIFSALAQPAVANGLLTMFQGIQSAVSALAPAMGPVGEALGSIMDLIGAMAASFGPVISSVLSTLAPIVSQIAQALIPIVNMLGPLLGNVITTLQPVFQALGDNIVKVVEAFQPLIEKVSELWQLVGPILVPVLQILVDILGSALVGVIQGVTMVIDGIIEVFNGFKTVIEGFALIFKGEFSEGFGKIFAGLGQIVMGALKAIGGGIMAWLNGTIVGIFRGGIVKLLGLWKGGWNGIKSAASSIWNAIKSLASGLWKAVKGFFSRGISTVKTIWTVGWTVMKALVTARWSSIKSLVSNAISAVRSTIQNILGRIKSLWQNGWNGIKTIVTNTWNNIKSGVQRGISAVMGFVKGLPGKIKGVFAGAGAWLINAGEAILDGLKEGIGRAWDRVKGKLQELTSKIPDWKGPRSRDKKLLFGVGQIIINGLSRGMESKFHSVRKKLEAFTKGLKAAAQESSKELRKAVMETGDITKLDTETFGGVVANLEEAVRRATDFKQTLKELGKLGLNPQSLSELAAAGPDSLELAASIAEAGKAGVDEINKLQAELAKQSRQSGRAIKGAMFESGVQVAQGILDGLRNRRGELVNEMALIARKMVREFKKRLGIRSPSLVFAQLGANISKGLVRGIESVTVEPPSIKGVSGNLAALVGGSSGGTTVHKTFIYNAAPGSSLGSEEDLFSAARRGRMAGF